MSHLGKTPWSQLALGCVLAALAAAAHADVTMQERLRVSGLVSLANMNGTTTTTIAGDRARTDSNLQFESGLVRAFAGGLGQSSEIVRLDQDKIYSLDPKKKTYTEMSFADQRARMQAAMQKTQESQASQQQAASGVDESQCEWSEPKADVKRTGEKATIAGYEAEHVSITATQSCKDKKTGSVCDFGLLLDEWVAPGFQQSAEVLAYHRAYAEKLGLGTPGSRDFAERAQSMFGQYKGIWTEIAAKMKDVQGYPLKASFGLGVGGPQCQNTQQQQASQSQDQGSGSSSSAASSPPPTSIGGAIGGALGGLFKKKEHAQPAAAETPPATMPGGLIPLMTVGTELVSVTSGAVNPQMFEVPADFKKKTE
jgi:hypothetical protein